MVASYKGNYRRFINALIKQLQTGDAITVMPTSKCCIDDLGNMAM